MAKRIRITIEIDSLLVARGRKPLSERCPECGAEAETIPLNELDLVSKLPPCLRAIVAAMFGLDRCGLPNFPIQTVGRLFNTVHRQYFSHYRLKTSVCENSAPDR
jgi:hypothetical protein